MAFLKKKIENMEARTDAKEIRDEERLVIVRAVIAFLARQISVWYFNPFSGEEYFILLTFSIHTHTNTGHFFWTT